MFFDDLDVRLMLLTAFVFLMLVWILNSILYKPLLGFMKNREDGIREDEAKIHQGNTDVSNNETLVAKIYADARAKCQVIRNECISSSKEDANKFLDEKKSVLEADYKNFLADLDAKKIVFKNELRNQLLSLDENIKSSINKI